MISYIAPLIQVSAGVNADIRFGSLFKNKIGIELGIETCRSLVFLDVSESGAVDRLQEC